MKSINKISKLLEQDLEQARLIFAIGDITDRLQTMIEQIAKMSVNDVMPIVDDMRGTFGPEKSSKFEGIANDALDEALEAVKKAKEAISNESLRLEGKDVPDNDMATDDLGDDLEDTEEASGEDMDMDIETNDEGLDDLFGGAESAAGVESEPLGRAKKNESVSYDQVLFKIVESGTYTKDDLRILAKEGISKKDLSMFTESTVNTRPVINENVNKKFVTKSIHKVLNRIVESGTYTKDDLKILAKEGIDRKDLKMFTESTVNTKNMVIESKKAKLRKQIMEVSKKLKTIKK